MTQAATLSHARSAEEMKNIDAYWRAANYLSVGQIYLYDNPLLKQPLLLSHVKPLVVGHWGTTPGQNFIYVHLNRVIKKYDLDMFYISGPGHGGPALVANTYLEGTYSEIYPDISQDEAGMKRLFTQFSFPGGISSHVAPTTPGSIHEGGELGYSLGHAAKRNAARAAIFALFDVCKKVDVSPFEIEYFSLTSTGGEGEENNTIEIRGFTLT